MINSLTLKDSLIQEYWKKKDPRLGRILKVMQNIEHWVLDEDNDDVKKKLEELAKQLEKTNRDQLAKNIISLVDIMGYIGAGKSMRIVSWMDENHPGLSMHMILEAKSASQQGVKTADLLLDRTRTIANLSLMNKIFSTNRSRLIIEILKEN